MASKRRGRTVEKIVLSTVPASTTKRPKSNRLAKKNENSKLIADLAYQVKTSLKQIEKPKLKQESTDKKPRKSSAKKPRKVHKIHTCNICDKVFKGLNDLRKHLRIHSNEVTIIPNVHLKIDFNFCLYIFSVRMNVKKKDVPKSSGKLVALRTIELLSMVPAYYSNAIIVV